MPREYDYYSPLSAETYDPYTAAPYYQYLFTDPSGLGPQGPISSKRDALGEQLAPNSTGVYDALPPPPKKFGITTSEAFSSSGNEGSSSSGSVSIGGFTFDFNTLLIIILAFMVWVLLMRSNKVSKILKKLKKALHKSSSGNITGAGEESIFE